MTATLDEVGVVTCRALAAGGGRSGGGTQGGGRESGVGEGRVEEVSGGAGTGETTTDELTASVEPHAHYAETGMASIMVRHQRHDVQNSARPQRGLSAEVNAWVW